MIPWVIKPVYGFLSDSIPIFGYKRRSYLILAGLIGCVSWLAYSVTGDLSSAVFWQVLASASIAVSDVVTDSIVVERSRDGAGTGGDLQSLCWGSAAIGGLISAYFSGSLLEFYSPRIIFKATAVFPLIISLAAFFISEAKESALSALTPSDTIATKIRLQAAQLWSAISNPKIYVPALFIFCWQATPSPDSALFFFQTNALGFKPEFLGSIRLAASIASLFGVVLFRTFLKDVSIKTIIFWASIASVPLALTQVLLTTHTNRALGIPDQLFALTDTVVLVVLGQIAFMPTLVLAANLCPPGVEGTLFATLMSIYNAASSVSSELGAGLTYALGINEKNNDNLSLLVIICALSSLLPLPFINAIDNKPEQSTSDEQDSGAVDSKLL